MFQSVWRLTRNPYGKRLYESLDAVGLSVAVLQVYRRSLANPAAPDRSDAVLRYHEPAAVGEPFRDADALDRADRVIGAYADGARIGSVLLTLDGPVHVDPLDRQFDPDGAYVWRLYVDPDHRRQGVGRTLVRAALWATANVAPSTDAVTALVARDNVPSQRVFAAAGFEPERELQYLRLGKFECRRSRTL